MFSSLHHNPQPTWEAIQRKEFDLTWPSNEKIYGTSWMMMSLLMKTQLNQVSPSLQQQKDPNHNQLCIDFQYLHCKLSLLNPLDNSHTFAMIHPLIGKSIPQFVSIHRKHVHADYKMPFIDLTATQQLRPLPSRQNTTLSHPSEKPPAGHRRHNSTQESQAVKTPQTTDNSSYDD